MLAFWLVSLAISDLGWRRLPNSLLLAGAVAALALMALAPSTIEGDAAQIAMRVGLALAVLLPAYFLGLMSAGDVKLGFVLALWFAGPDLVMIWTVGGVLGGLHAVGLLAQRRSRRRAAMAAGPITPKPASRGGRLQIPYGAYLAFGALANLAAGTGAHQP